MTCKTMLLLILQATVASSTQPTLNYLGYLPQETSNDVQQLDHRYVCQISGDNHITTFDNMCFSAWGGESCSYILAMDCYFASWMIYVKMAHNGEVSRSVAEVTVHQGGSYIVMGRGWQIQSMDREVYMVEGREQYVGRGFSARLLDNQLTLTFSDFRGSPVAVSWDGWTTVTVRTRNQYTCGLCGNNNGVATDDFQNAWFGPRTIGSGEQFMGSWAVENSASCTALAQNKTCESPDYKDEVRCNLVFDSKILQSQCLASELEYHRQQCYLDTCFSMDIDTHYPYQCQMGASLAALCEARGGNTAGWQSEVGCPDRCTVRSAVIATGASPSYPPWTRRCPVSHW